MSGCFLLRFFQPEERVQYELHKVQQCAARFSKKAHKEKRLTSFKGTSKKGNRLFTLFLSNC